MRRTVKEYIKKSNNNIKKKWNEFTFLGTINGYIKDPLPDDIDLSWVLEQVEKRIPNYLIQNVESIMIGDFHMFQEMDTNSKYENGVIYVTNNQDDNEDLLDDIVHEIAHSVEQLAGMEIYEDGTVVEEFLGKRVKLYRILHANDMSPNMVDFLNPEYSDEYDIYLYQEIGYPLLANFSLGLFISPYAVTSLREYFASGFEEYFLKEEKYLREISPVLYNKIELISEL